MTKLTKQEGIRQLTERVGAIPLIWKERVHKANRAELTSHQLIVRKTEQVTERDIAYHVKLAE